VHPLDLCDAGRELDQDRVRVGLCWALLTVLIVQILLYQSPGIEVLILTSVQKRTLVGPADGVSRSDSAISESWYRGIDTDICTEESFGGPC
jgi:hypothetical protein